MVGDGYWDDVTNNAICNYDGGDCCLHEIETSFCTECQCLRFEDGSDLPIKSEGTKQHIVLSVYKPKQSKQRITKSFNQFLNSFSLDLPRIMSMWKNT